MLMVLLSSLQDPESPGSQPVWDNILNVGVGKKVSLLQAMMLEGCIQGELALQ